MKTLFFSFLFLTGLLTLSAQTANKEYDAELAKKLGADDRGMKYYIFVVLKTGTANITDKPLRDSLFRGHMSNINRLAEIGKLVVAGPFGNNDDGMRGLFILDVKSIDEARELMKSDPTISEKIFEAQYYPWYGSAALPEYLKVHRKIEK
jgi:uncharacterized protein YciI